jgi:Zn-dependent M32 family carboxypeptidase
LYRELEERQRKLGHLEELSEILGWDEAVIMPEAAGPRRGEAMATLSVLIHELAADPELGEQIAAGEFSALNSWLGDCIWSKASSLDIDELMTKATGGPLDVAYFERYLERRFLA